MLEQAKIQLRPMMRMKILFMFILLYPILPYAQELRDSFGKNYEHNSSLGTITCIAPDSLFLQSQYTESIKKLTKDTLQTEYIKFYQIAANYAMLNEVDSAYFYLHKFVETSPDDRMLYVDTRWDILKKDTLQWKYLIAKMEKAYLNCIDSASNKKLALHLFYLGALDQKYRIYASVLHQLPKGDSFYIASSQLDQFLSQQIESIFEKYGFPDIPMVGKSASTTAFLLVQHSNKINKYYKAVKKCYEQGNVIPQQYALMTDRYLMQKKRRQIYGTQGFINSRIKKKYDGHGIIWPMKDFKHIDERRKSVGISKSIEEYAKSIDCVIPEKYYKK